MKKGNKVWLETDVKEVDGEYVKVEVGGLFAWLRNGIPCEGKVIISEKRLRALEQLKGAVLCGDSLERMIELYEDEGRGGTRYDQQMAAALVAIKEAEA